MFITAETSQSAIEPRDDMSHAPVGSTARHVDTAAAKFAFVLGLGVARSCDSFETHLHSCARNCCPPHQPERILVQLLLAGPTPHSLPRGALSAFDSQCAHSRTVHVVVERHSAHAAEHGRDKVARPSCHTRSRCLEVHEVPCVLMRARCTCAGRWRRKTACPLVPAGTVEACAVQRAGGSKRALCSTLCPAAHCIGLKVAVDWGWWWWWCRTSSYNGSTHSAHS
jgi:hypothetical protein